MSPIGVSGRYVLMGASPTDKARARVEAEAKARVGTESKPVELKSYAFVRTAACLVEFELIEKFFLYEFYNSLSVDVRSFIESAKATENNGVRSEIIKLCQDKMGEVDYRAHLLSWGEICWHSCDDKKDQIEIYRFERDVLDTSDPRLEILSKPLRDVCPDCEIKYRVKRFQHQLCRQD